MPRFTRDPGAALKSLVVSARTGGVRGLSTIPLVVSREARIRIARGGSVVVDGRLWVGH